MNSKNVLDLLGNFPTMHFAQKIGLNSCNHTEI